jgi:hypothetical protein
MATRTIRVVDSHTAGEPTRVIIEGGPDLGSGSMAERRDRFRRDFDAFRSAVVNELAKTDRKVTGFFERNGAQALGAGSTSKTLTRNADGTWHVILAPDFTGRACLYLDIVHPAIPKG